jgi:hypothetical protein
VTFTTMWSFPPSPQLRQGFDGRAGSSKEGIQKNIRFAIKLLLTQAKIDLFRNLFNLAILYAVFVIPPTPSRCSWLRRAGPLIFYVIPPTLKLATEDRPGRTFLSSRARTRDLDLPNLESIKKASSKPKGLCCL